MDKLPTKTILVMAGGTGGHIYPALAVADELKQRDNKVYWLGSKQGMENELVPKYGYDLHTIEVKALRCKGLLRWCLMPFVLTVAIYQAWKVIKTLNPDVALGMGGFAAGPGGIAAWLSRVPLVLQEQNAIAGLTNRCLFPFAKYVLTGFPDVFEYSSKLKHTGNPVRSSIQHIEKTNTDKEVLKLLVLGGSLGAQFINKLLPEFKKHTTLPLKIRHQCGERDLFMTQTAYENFTDVEVLSFIEDMADAYAWADIVICRAGALTVCEVCLAGVAAIFVPFPYAVDDHQAANARYLSDNKAGLFIRQEHLTVEYLEQTIQPLHNDRKKLEEIAKKAFSLAKPDATSEVSDICLEVAHA